MSFLISISIYPQPINSIKIYFTTQNPPIATVTLLKSPKIQPNLQKKSSKKILITNQNHAKNNQNSPKTIKSSKKKFIQKT